MTLSLTIPKVAFLGTSVASNVDILATSIFLSSAANQSRGIYRIQMRLSASGVVSVIHKDTTGSTYATCALNSGTQLAAGNMYGFVYAINNRTLYNFQTTQAGTIVGQIDEIQGTHI